MRRPRTAEPLVRSGTAGPLVEAGALAWVVRTTVAHRVVVPPVVMAVMAQVGDFEAGEEDGRDDEQDSGDDHYPRREPVEPIRFNGLCRMRGGNRGRPGWGFRCFTHETHDAWVNNGYGYALLK